MEDVTSDLSLVRRAQAGERHAFDLLVLKYQARIQKVAERYLRNPDDAKDVVQDAFLKAYLALRDFRGESAFYTWLCSIAINSAKNALKRYLRRERGAANVPLSDRESSAVPEQLKDYSTPEAFALEGDLLLQLTSSMAGLSHDLRATLLLRVIGGLSYEQIAERTQDPVGTVRSRLFRAREAVLRPTLQ
jgi:RNA polymerase sigma-70 factor, ECF subfamily